MIDWKCLIEFLLESEFVIIGTYLFLNFLCIVHRFLRYKEVLSMSVNIQSDKYALTCLFSFLTRHWIFKRSICW